MGSNNLNGITIYTSSMPGGISGEGSDLNHVVEVTNNRARYYAELAKSYMEQARSAKNDAQYYAEQNSDVTKVYVDGIKTELLDKIDLCQPAGNYALQSELPVKVSDLTNDSGFITSSSISNKTITISQDNVSAGDFSLNQNSDETINIDLSGKANVTLSNVSNKSGLRKLIEVYSNDYSWYKVFSEYDFSTGNLIGNWCEQGGLFTMSAASGTVNLLKNYKDNYYSVFIQAYRDASYYSYESSVLNKMTSSFDWVINSNANYIGSFWEAKGYIA